jgi:hypothetical protein
MAMSKGKATGTAASAELLAADEYRCRVVIMKVNATPVAIGIGEAAVADEGIILNEIGDVAELNDEAARAQINIIGNGGTITYQVAPVTVRLNPNTP